MRGRSSLLVTLAVVAGAAAMSALGLRAGAQVPPKRPGAAPPSAAPSAGAAPSASAVASASAAPSGGDVDMPRRSDRVVAYTLGAELFPDTHSVRGTGTIVWRNTARVATDRLFVHLYLNAFKNSRTVFWRVPLSDFRGYPLDGPGHMDVEKFHVRELDEDVWPEHPTTPGDPDDATDIEVPLPRPIQPGESLTIDMAWTSHLPTVTIRTGYYGSFHMVAQWFPKIARLEEDGTWSHFPFHRLSEFYADYGTYDVTVTAPRSFTIGAVGALVSEGPSPDAPSTSPSPATTTARQQSRYLAEDVHDFAFAAWDQFHSIDETTPEGVKIRCLFPPGHEAVARTEISTVKFGLGYFGAAFGRYPYKTLTIVHPPSEAIEAGGMEYPTLITTGGSWMHDPLGGRELEIVTLHELAHQWFYGMVGTNEHRWPFLDEGLTSYAEGDACEAAWPDASAGELWGLRVGLPAIYRIGALQSKRNTRVSQSAAGFVSGQDYASLVYSRTETALRTLGNVYGEDTVRRAIGVYARRNRFGHPGPDELFAAIREGVGDDAATALRAALMSPSSVDYTADVVRSERRDDGHPGYVGHVLVRRRGEIRLPVDVVLIAEDGATERLRWDAVKEAEWLPYEGETKLVGAVVDPDHRVLLDEDLSNNAVSSTGSSFAWRVLEEASFGAGVLARGLLP